MYVFSPSKGLTTSKTWPKGPRPKPKTNSKAKGEMSIPKGQRPMAKGQQPRCQGQRSTVNEGNGMPKRQKANGQEPMANALSQKVNRQRGKRA